jgi:hypothetical protein
LLIIFCLILELLMYLLSRVIETVNWPVSLQTADLGFIKFCKFLRILRIYEFAKNLRICGF